VLDGRNVLIVSAPGHPNVVGPITFDTHTSPP
jgi:hypothetical protein